MSTPTSATGICTDAFARRARAFRASGQGFTLLELLVVVTIIGVLAGAVVLSVGLARSEAREIEHEVLRLSSLLDLAREEAIMQSREFAVLFAESGYRFYVFDHMQQTWVTPEGDALLRSYALPEPLRVDLRVEGRNLVLEPTLALAFDEDDDDENTAPQPQLMLLSSGEMTAFEATFYRDPTRGRVVLTGELNGDLELRKEGFDGR